MSLRVTRSAAVCLFLASICLPCPSDAHKGVASGRVAIIDAGSKAYGFSSSVGTWKSVTLDSALKARLAATYLGYVRTEKKIYAFNSTTNGWYSTPYTGTAHGEDAQGSTLVVWTSDACYGISTVWGAWRAQSISAPLGGGSGGNYGLVWTKDAAYAYSSSNGQWSTQTLSSVPVGGHASSGLGLIWTAQTAYVYDPVARRWSSLSIADPSGVSVDGSGKVGVVWNATLADAYSAYLGSWSELPGSNWLLGGVSGDEVALLWTDNRAFAFDPHAGTWAQLDFDISVMAGPELDLPQEAFSIGPNPAADRLSIRLPGASHPWRIVIVNLDGSRVRTLESPESMDGGELIWDQRDETGNIVPSGTYWVRAQSGERVEARRFVVLH